VEFDIMIRINVCVRVLTGLKKYLWPLSVSELLNMDTRNCVTDIQSSSSSSTSTGPFRYSCEVNCNVESPFF
jgi:hypothetical protein